MEDREKDKATKIRKILFHEAVLVQFFFLNELITNETIRTAATISEA